MPPKRGRDSTEPADGSLDVLAKASVVKQKIHDAENNMVVLHNLCGCSAEPNNTQVVFGNIVIQRNGSRICAHHITDPTVAYDMDRPPYFWIEWLKKIFAPKKQCVEEPVPTAAPAINSVNNKEFNSVNNVNFNILLCLLAKLPAHDKLVIVRTEDGKIILQVLGTLLDAVITIEKGEYFECSTVTEPGQLRLCVPWETPKPNEPLGAQVMVIPEDAPSWYMEIIGKGNRLVGIHHYTNVGGIVCITSPNQIERLLFTRSQHPKFEKNKNLVVVKTPGTPFSGVIKTFKKRERDGYRLENDELLPLKGTQSLDVVMQNFKRDARF
jgi:hypothetical protein